MSKPDATEWIENWVKKNLRILGGVVTIATVVDYYKPRMLADAKADDLTEAELKEAVGDLGDYLGNAYNALTPLKGVFRSGAA